MPQQWPTAGDYATALQNPQNCFRVPQFQQGKAGKRRMGMPVGSDGNAAIVFEWCCPGTTYAIKCFKRAVSDRQQHYDELSQRLNALSSPYLTDFTYLPDTILIRGEWFPILRMSWVSPNQLGYHLNQCLTQKKSHTPLTNSFRDLVRELSRMNLVHGDLQHGNILVESSGQLRLIDYDGTCVLPWQGTLPDERGHPNYQHPERLRDGYYDKNTDAFAAQVIYLSLLALEAEPSLWNDFNNAENLIFTKNDFDAPGQLPLWSRLHQSSDPEVRRLTDKLEEACRTPVNMVIPLEDLLTPATPKVAWYRQPHAPISSSNATTVSSSPTGVSFPSGSPLPVTTVNHPTGASNSPGNYLGLASLSGSVTNAGLPIAPIWAGQNPTGVTASPTGLIQDPWSDILSRQLRWILVSIAVIAIVTGIGVFMWLNQVVPTPKASLPSRGVIQKASPP